MKESLDLCVSCKGCKRDCPTGVDMARMKIEVLHHYHKRHGLPLRERLIANMPRYAPFAARLAPILNLRDRVPFLAKLSEKWLGFSAKRTLPQWRKPWKQVGAPAAPHDMKADGRDLILFVTRSIATLSAKTSRRPSVF
jgi:Fe-S oxidoreductase